MRIVMMGTGTFAVPTLEALYASDHDVIALYTQPDRTGRGHHHHPHPMKDLAVDHATLVVQPSNANSKESLDQLRNLQPDICVVAAYGQILSKELLEIPRLGAINLHASILPKFRGAAPVQFAVLKGERETGVTIFQIDPKLDAGPILAIVRTAIGRKETSGELEHRLARLAVPALIECLDRLDSGTSEAIHQDTSLVTRAPRLKKGDGIIDWSATATAIDCHVRGMQPWPKAFTFLQSATGAHPPLRLILLDVEPNENESAQPAGTVVATTAHDFEIQTGQGSVKVLRLQPDGKRAMTTAEFLCGHTVKTGDTLTNNVN